MLIKISMANWSKHNPRSDRANYTWFRFQNTFFTDQETFLLTDSQRSVLLFAMCEMSKKNAGSLELLQEYICAILRKPWESIVSDLTRLHSLRLLAVELPPNGGVKPALLPATDGRTDETDEKHERPSVAAEAAPLSLPLEPANEEPARTYDRDHESVIANQKPNELPRLALLWNLRRHPSLPEVKLCSPSRRRHAANRWKENPNEEFWLEVLERVNASKFCLGANQRGWKADFDFLMRPDSAAKVLEGKYDNPGGPGGSSPSTKKSYWARLQEEAGRD